MTDTQENEYALSPRSRVARFRVSAPPPLGVTKKQIGFGWCSAIDRDVPTIVFNPCGHAASKEVTESMHTQQQAGWCFFVLFCFSRETTISRSFRLVPCSMVVGT